MSEHARLSPSGYSRWGVCHLSLDLEATMPDTTSPYAELGTRLHEEAQKHLRAGTDIDLGSGSGSGTSISVAPGVSRLTYAQAETVQTYLDHVRAESYGGDLLIEQKLKLDGDLWGTADAVIFVTRQVGGQTQNILTIVDLKTGSGVKVFAKENGQLQIYAVLARFEWGAIYGPFDRIELHIVQPPLDHIDVWSLTNDTLDAFEQELLATIARINSGDRRAVPGEKQCLFCRAKAVCRARAEHSLAAIRSDFAAPATLSIAEVANLLPQVKQITDWCAAIETHALQQAGKGVTVPGYKLVAGRSSRTWRSEKDAAEALSICGIPDAKLWNRKLIGITETEMLIGKSHPVFGEQTVKPQGKSALVPEKDPRPELAQGADFTAVIV